MGGQARIIFHVDMNSFYASVEQVAHPEYRGKPIAIAGRVEERRGIIVTSSYEARAKGVKTTMRVREAKRLCPELILLTPNFSLYREASVRLFSLLRTYTPLVEKVSIDEGYLDVTEAAASMHPIRLAQKIQAEIKARLQLPSSIGIAPNKFLAKMASNMKKPMGLTILRKRELPQLLWPLPIEEMHGVGPKTAEKLHQLNINTIGDLARSDPSQIKNGLGQQGEKLHQRANGCDSRPVDPKAESVYKSMSQSTTLPTDLTQLNEARPHFKRFSKKLMDKLSQQGKVAYQIQVQIRYSNWEYITRMKTFTEPIPGSRELETAAMALFSDHWSGRPVRLLGLSVQQLEDKLTQSKQLDLFSFEKEAQKEPLYKVVDALKTRYGQGLIQFGVKETSQPEEET